jgi:phage-related protein
MEDSKAIVTVTKPVKEFIYSLDEATFAKILRNIELLEKFGRMLKMPHCKKINKELYELRVRGRQEIRIFYAFIQEKIFLLHGFIKKSDKIPLKDIELAMRRLAGLTDL